MGIIKDQNAQFLLIAGFVIAAGLVITTIMLNNIIFESNMASESGTEPSKYDIVNMLQISRDEVRSAYRNATMLGGTEMISNFSRQMNKFSGNLSKIYALHGEGVNMSLNVSNWNNLNYPYFTDNGTVNGEDDWVVIENVKNISIFELRNITRLGSFEVYITNQTTGAFIWSMKLIGGFQVQVDNSSGTIGSGPFNVNFDYINLLNSSYYLNESIGSNTVKISFKDGDAAYGRFNITGISATNSKSFIRARDYVLNTTVTLSTGRLRANITIPVYVPW